LNFVFVDTPHPLENCDLFCPERLHTYFCEELAELILLKIGDQKILYLLCIFQIQLSSKGFRRERNLRRRWTRLGGDRHVMGEIEGENLDALYRRFLDYK